MTPLQYLFALATVVASAAVAKVFSRRKDSADTAAVLTGTAIQLMDQMTLRLDAAEEQIRDLKDRLNRAEERERLTLAREAIALKRIAAQDAEIADLKRQDAARLAREDQAIAVTEAHASHSVEPIRVDVEALDVTIIDRRQGVET